jgi:hypothetical protein
MQNLTPGAQDVLVATSKSGSCTVNLYITGLPNKEKEIAAGCQLNGVVVFTIAKPIKARGEQYVGALGLSQSSALL